MSNLTSIDRPTNRPVISDTIQPWLNPEVTSDVLLSDLESTVYHFWSLYKGNLDYSIDDAKSDAHEGILKAIEKDRMSVRLKAGKAIICSHCKHVHNIEEDIVAERNDATTTFNMQCPNCNENFEVVVCKVKFNTLAFPYIRSSIQKGIRFARSKAISISIPISENRTIEDLLCAKTNDIDNIPSAIIVKLEEAMDDLPINHQNIVSMVYGITKFGDFDGTVTKTVSCKDCGNKYKIEFDYKGANHVCSKCELCGTENTNDLSLTQTEVANILGVSKQRICNVCSGVIKKLRPTLEQVIKKFEYTL